MSNNSKFLKNRLKKLIGKSREQESNIQRLQAKRTSRDGQEGSLFHDYTYISLESRNGKVSHRYRFACFRQGRVFGEHNFPLKEDVRFDNDEESNFTQIKGEIARGWNVLQAQASVLEQDRRPLRPHNPG